MGYRFCGIPFLCNIQLPVSSRADRRPVHKIADLDAGSFRACVDDLSAADINPYMTRIAHDISCLQIA